MQAQTVVPLKTYQDDAQTLIQQGLITDTAPDDFYMVDYSIRARQAFSCVIKPEAGDTVLYALTEINKEAFVLTILKRRQPQQAQLELPENETLCIQGKKLKLLAHKEVEIASLGELSLTAALGALSINSMHLFQTATESLIQNAKNHISKVHNYALNAKQLLRLHGKQQIITADQDVRIDGERINMG